MADILCMRSQPIINRSRAKHLPWSSSQGLFGWSKILTAVIALDTAPMGVTPAPLPFHAQSNHNLSTVITNCSSMKMSLPLYISPRSLTDQLDQRLCCVSAHAQSWPSQANSPKSPEPFPLEGGVWELNYHKLVLLAILESYCSSTSKFMQCAWGTWNELQYMQYTGT